MSGPLTIDELDTPALVVDLDAFERNVRLCIGERLKHVRVRPHQKTAKSPDVAKRLIEAGAQGICVAKLSEAEVMLAAGIDDVLVTTELAGPIKARRLAEVVDRFPYARLTVVVDSVEGASALNEALPRPVTALIDLNVGQDRAGVAPQDAPGLAARLRELENLRVVGVQGYEGNLQLVRSVDERRQRCDEAMERLAGAVEALRADGHAIEVVTTGGTGTAEFCAAHDVVTEVQPGSFVFMDVAYGETGGVPYEQALHALATVISLPLPGRGVIDAGLKTLSTDSGPARLVDLLGWSYAHAGDEHGILTRLDADRSEELHVGDRVMLVPSHIDTTVNLHDVLHVHRGGEVVEHWTVAARGKIQ